MFKYFLWLLYVNVKGKKKTENLFGHREKQAIEAKLSK